MDVRTRRNNRWIAVGIVTSAVLAACIGDLTLSTSESQVLSVPSNVMIGTTMVNTPLTSAPILLTSVSSSDLDRIQAITPYACGAAWSAAPSTPLPRDVCSSGSGSSSGSGCQYPFTVTFRPTVPGVQSCAVIIDYTTISQMGPFGSSTSSDYQVTINVSATGVAPMYGLVVTPQSLDFNDVRVGIPASQMVRVQNTGSAPVQLTAGVVSPPFSISPNVGTEYPMTTLAAGSSAAYTLTCTPSAIGAVTSSMKLIATPGDASSAQTLALACTGVDANLYIQPTPLNFPRDVRVGSPPQDLAVQFVNSSGVPVTLEQVFLETGTEVSIVDPPTGTLINNGQVTFYLHYKASVEQAFGLIDRLIVKTPSGQRTAAINAEALVADIGTSPPSVDFGPICTKTTKTVDVQLYTTASSSVVVTSITPPDAPFSAPTQATKLEGNHGNIATVTTSVHALEPGELASHFTINTDIPTRPTQDIAMSALALPDGASATPGELNFGASKIGMLTTAKTIVIANCTSSPRAIASARISGADAAQFTIVSPANLTPNIEMASTLEFLIVMSPSSVGDKTAQLDVQFDDGTIVSTMLAGSGVVDGREKTTYYTCSTGGGAAGLPLGLALLVLARRRRRLRA